MPPDDRSDIKRANRRYVQEELAKGARQRRKRRSSLRVIVLWVLFVVAFVTFWEIFSVPPAPGDVRPAATAVHQVPAEDAATVQLLVDWIPVALILVVFGLPLTLILIRRRRAILAIFAALQQPDANALITARVRPLSRVSIGPRARAAGARAASYVLYGDVFKARAALADVQWETCAPMIHAMGLGIEALLVLLCTGDAEEGLRLAREGQRLSAYGGITQRLVPTSWKFNTVLGLAEVMCDVATPETMAGLEACASSKARPTGRLIAAYALAIACDRRGETRRAEAYRAQLRTEAPHCAPLLAAPGEACAPLPTVDQEPTWGGVPLENRWEGKGAGWRYLARRAYIWIALLWIVLALIYLTMGHL